MPNHEDMLFELTIILSAAVSAASAFTLIPELLELLK